MRTFVLFLLGVLLGGAGGIALDRNTAFRDLVDTQLQRYAPGLFPPPSDPPDWRPQPLGDGANLSAATLADYAIEPCFPRPVSDPPAERSWLQREVNAAGLTEAEALGPIPDLSAYPGLIKIEGIRSSLGTEREHCAAVRVAEHWFMTAAHCIIDLDLRTARPTYDVIAITPGPDVRAPDTAAVGIDGAVCHAAYGMNRQQYPNDIALFYISDVSAFDSVAIAELESGAHGLIASDFAVSYISGWGKNGGTRYLQGGPVRMSEIGEAVLIGDRVGSRGPNVGDSGAPLYLGRAGASPLVIGTLSQVTQDALQNGDRSIYIRTKSVFDWVTRTMQICERDGAYICQPTIPVEELPESVANNP